ncbi:hypothetical protein QIH24_28800, partial [Klebsiella pneumoniae]|nr:hypothetical protein [Klebsiella pneumoniae]
RFNGLWRQRWFPGECCGVHFHYVIHTKPFGFFRNSFAPTHRNVGFEVMEGFSAPFAGDGIRVGVLW